jgi:DNA-binding beta-propeller fold protein YncE
MRPTLRSLAAACALLAAGAALADTLLVVRKSANSVEFVEPGTGTRLMSVAVGLAPHEIAVAPDGRRAIVTNYGTTAAPGNTVSLLNLERPHEIERIDLGRHTRPHGVAWYAADRVAITAEGSGRLLILDPAARRIVAEIPTGQSVSHMVAVTRDGTRAFVTNIDSGTTTAIDLAGGRKLRDLETGAGSEAIAISPDGRYVWVAARRTSEIALIDATTLEIVKRLQLEGEPIRIALTPSGGTAIVSCAGSGDVVAIDTQALAIVARRRLEPQSAAGVAAANAGDAAIPAPRDTVPIGLAVSADGRSVYVAATAANAVLRLELPGLAVAQTIAVPGEPDGLGSSPLLPKYECHACEKPPD